MLNPAEEIKSRLDIIELIREYIPQLKQVGSNWKACCPFHNEKTPSFMVSKERQIFKCFGCGEGGDIISFVMKMEGIEFPEALRNLAKRAGVTLPDYRENPQLATKKTKLLDILSISAKFFAYHLEKNPRAKIARDYLEKRKMRPQTAIEFQIGYSPDKWDGLLEFLRSRKFSDQDIFDSGLSVRSDRGGYYDRFRGRLMFPIRDLHGNVVGFTARILKEDDKQGKYINTPQTMVYDKSSVIYGLDKAKLAARGAKKIILVEGQMDCISSHEAGIKNVVATSGTALTPAQIRLLKRYANELLFSFDSDSAGEEAAKRAIDLALEKDINVKIIRITEGKDPDECIKNDPQDWIDAIAGAAPIMEYYFDNTFSKLDMGRAEDKKKASNILLPIISKIANKVEQSHWLQVLANKLNVSEEILRESLAIPKMVAIQEAEDSDPGEFTENNEGSIPPILAQIFALCLRFPKNIDYLSSKLKPEFVNNDKLLQFYKNLIMYYNKEVSYPQLKLKLNEKLDSVSSQILAELEMFFDKEFPDIKEDEAQRELLGSLKQFNKNHILSQLKKIEHELKEAENNKTAYPDYQRKIKELSDKFSRLTEQLSNLE